MIIIYLFIFLFVMGQKAFYLDLLQVLKISLSSRREPSGDADFQSRKTAT